MPDHTSSNREQALRDAVRQLAAGSRSARVRRWLTALADRGEYAEKGMDGEKGNGHSPQGPLPACQENKC